jgi:hypothetical protein
MTNWSQGGCRLTTGGEPGCRTCFDDIREIVRETHTVDENDGIEGGMGRVMHGASLGSR